MVRGAFVGPADSLFSTCPADSRPVRYQRAGERILRMALIRCPAFSALVALLWLGGFAAVVSAQSEPPLVEAAINRDLPKVRALLQGKVDVNTRSSDGSTALLWAVHRDDAGIADVKPANGDLYRVQTLEVYTQNSNGVWQIAQKESVRIPLK